MDLDKIINSSPAKKGWESIGLKRHHGINTPVFSLRTKNSSGIGEFLDLIPLIDFCHQVNFSILQLLPVNDSGLDPSPYNALSTRALNPIYISLHTLPFVTSDDLKEFKLLDKLPFIDYPKVLFAKMDFLKNYFVKHFHHLREDLSYKAFVDSTEWLKPYALFKVFKNRFENRRWNQWEERYKNPSKEDLEQFYAQEYTEMEFYFLLQYFAFRQLKWVKTYANEKGIFLKGDIPILISPDSVEVWLERENFHLDYSAGAPPDAFTKDGQNWNFPIYNWEVIEKNHYHFWKTRLQVAAEFFDLIRIDHIIGFYRIWAIKIGTLPTSGSFWPQEGSESMHQGEKILTHLFSSTTMLPIGEDLGPSINPIRKSLTNLGIPGTKLIIWEKRYESDSSFIPFNEYPALSLTTISTHDTTSFRQWWIDHPHDAQMLCQNLNLPYTTPLPVESHLEILKATHHSSSLFHIHLLHEYLALDPTLLSSNPKDDQINIPGTENTSNWTNRYLPQVEDLLVHVKLIEMMRLIIESK